MFLHRPGGQTQFAAPVWAPRAERSTVRAVQALVEAAPGGEHPCPALAAAAAMSVRHFSSRVHRGGWRIAGPLRRASAFGSGSSRTRRRLATRSMSSPHVAVSAPLRQCDAHSIAASASHPIPIAAAFARSPSPQVQQSDKQKRNHEQRAGRHPTVPEVHRARRHRSIRSAAAHSIDRRHLHRAQARRGAQRERFPRHHRRWHVRRLSQARRAGVPRRRRHSPAAARRAGRRMGAQRPQDIDIHDIGVHRLARARRRRNLEGPDRDHPLGVLSRDWRYTARSRPPNASSNTSTSASSPPPEYQAASTWRCDSSSCSSTAPPPKPRN